MSANKLWLITFCLDNCQICVEGMFFKHSKTHIFLFLHDNWDEDGIFSLIQQLSDFLHLRSNLSAWKLQNRTNGRYRKILISFNSLFSLNYELVVQCAYTPKIILKKVEVLGFFAYVSESANDKQLHLWTIFCMQCLIWYLKVRFFKK